MSISRIYLLALLMVLCLGALPSVAQDKYVRNANEEIYGTWVNEEMFPAKMVKLTDGSYEDYYPASAGTPFRGGKQEIIRKWTDSDGNVFYETVDTFTFGSIKGIKTYNLWKVSNGRAVMEMNWSEGAQFPKEIDPKGYNYFIFHRSEK